MADATGDIFRDGQPFRINLGSYKVKDIVDFAPRATVPGNSSMMSDLSLCTNLWYRQIGNMDLDFTGTAIPRGILRPLEI